MNQQVVIIGAGLAGLAVAYELNKQQIPFALLEKSGHVGGVVQSFEQDGFLGEMGPNSILGSNPVVEELLEELGLQERKVLPSALAKKRYIVKKGKLRALPTSFGSFLTTPLFSPQAKLRLLKEPFIAPASQEESVAEFVQRRLGEEFLDYAINPFVAGVYAASPENLSIEHAFPRLHAMEQQAGSLLKAAFSRKKRPVSQQQPPRQRGGKIFSFPQGLQELPRALAGGFSENILLQSNVYELKHQAPYQWQVNYQRQGEESSLQASHVVYAAPSHALENLTCQQQPGAEFFSPVPEISYPPLAVVVLGFAREQVQHSLDGFGMLVPTKEKRNILGVLFSSSLFPNRAPDNHVTLTVFIGGERQPENALASREEILAMVEKDLEGLLGVRGKPVFCKTTLWERAIPQYKVGFGKYKERIKQLQEEYPGLYFAGNYCQGVSVPDTIWWGLQQAKKIVQNFSA